MNESAASASSGLGWGIVTDVTDVADETPANESAGGEVKGESRSLVLASRGSRGPPAAFSTSIEAGLGWRMGAHSLSLSKKS